MRKRAKVVITDFQTEPLDEERRILDDLASVEALNAVAEKELIGRIEDADCVILYHLLTLTRRTIDQLAKCRLIVRGGVGFDNVDGAAARARGIPVANVPDYGTEDVADSALGMTLALTRGIHFLNNFLQARKGPWTHTHAAPVRRLRGRVFGVIGLGRIGTAAALRAKAFGMEVVFYDPFVPQGRDKSLAVRRAETLSELLKQSHVVSLHCPLTPETKHLINRDTLALLPRGSFVVNTARGGVVDVLAVLEGVTSGQLAGAGLDVLETEPPADDHPLMVAWRDPQNPIHDRVIVNPHAAFYSEEGAIDMRVKAAQNCRRVLLGEAPWNVVN
ncbi:MAG TPA: C-terminal binding protein [Verrucomicrobiota bacterium]|nr:C-terminal binding protein [Verrucomicrobiota bacterium]